MNISVLYSKIHRARVTACHLDYNGSLGIDKNIIARACLIPGQKIDVLNVNNGARFTTYIIEEAAGSNAFGVYGAAARLVQKNDIIIIIAYASMPLDQAKVFKPHIILMD